MDFPETDTVGAPRIPRSQDAGWSSSVARRAHNPEVASSNLAPATNEEPGPEGPGSLHFQAGVERP